MNGQVFHDKLAIDVLLHHNFRQVKQACCCMFLIKKVIAIGIVDLKVADADLELAGSLFSHVLEYVTEGSRDYATISISLSATRDSKCLSRASLSVGKYGAIVALEGSIDHVLGHLVEDGLLLGQHVEDAVELEHVVVVLDLLMAQTIPLKVELHLAIIWGQGQTWVRLLRWPYPQIDLDALLLAFAHFLKYKLSNLK